MILNEKNMLEGLKNSNLIGQENIFFSCFVLPTVGQYAILGPFAGALQQFSGYIINKTESGIGILPIYSLSAKFAYDKAIFIPNDSISQVIIKKGGLFSYKNITIVCNNNEAISFKIAKNVLSSKSHKQNIEKFISLYQ